MASEESPLLGSVQEDANKPTIKKPSRTVVVEPALFVWVLFQFPTIMLSTQYLTMRIAENMGGDNRTEVSNATHNCSTDRSDPAFIFQEKVQAASSYLNLYCDIAATVPAFFVSLFLGGYSDKAGRKYSIVPPLVSSSAKMVIVCTIIQLKLPVELWILGSFVDGLGGYFYTVLMGCFSYVSDITTAETRAFRITVLELIMICPAIISAFGSGFWVEYFGYVYPFLMALGGNVICIIYVIFFVPETIQKPEAVKFFTLDHMKGFLNIFLHENETHRRWRLNLLLMALFFPVTAQLGNSIDTLFVMNNPLCWGAVMIGIFSSISITATVVGGAISSKLLKYCMPDIWVAAFAGMLSTIKCIYTAFVVNTAMMFLTPVMSVFSILMTPNIRTEMSKLVEPTEYGAMFSGVAMTEIVCSLVGHGIFNPIYSSTTYIMTGFIFFVLAGFYALGVLCVLIYIWKSKQEKRNMFVHEILVDPN